MRKIKIGLILFVLTGICALIFYGVQRIMEPGKVKAAENQYTNKINNEIEKIKTLPDNKFCKDSFNNVTFEINDFYSRHRFSNKQPENELWKENLESTLYSVYAEKFIKQSMIVLNGSLWVPDDLQFIQKELIELKGSKFLVEGSPVDNEFNKIQTALNKYTEISSLISSCNAFSCSNHNLDDRFPIADIQSKISRAEALLSNNLENVFVNNCARLHAELLAIPETLFEKNVEYLDNKINDFSDRYSEFTSHNDYVNNLHILLRGEIEELNNDIYRVNDFDSQYNKLLQKWSADNTKAYNYKY